MDTLSLCPSVGGLFFEQESIVRLPVVEPVSRTASRLEENPLVLGDLFCDV